MIGHAFAARDVPRWHGPVLAAVYLLIALSPLIVIRASGADTDHPFAYQFGTYLALVGYAVLTLQFVLSARLSWVERPFGLDVLFLFHRAMGMLAAALLLAHPLVLAVAGEGPALFVKATAPWHIWAGRAALLILLLQAASSLARLPLRLEYQTWLALHNVLAALLLCVGFAHSWFAGEDVIDIRALRFLWLTLLSAATLAYLWRRLVLPRRLRARSMYVVSDVTAETPDVRTLILTPRPGTQRADFMPGQFHFLTFESGGEVPAEEHHFTISSSPTEPGVLRSTVKAVGDFTRLIGRAKPGDAVAVHGPFGRFSYVLRPEERDLVFIAGGIGITPFMSMLRHMRDTCADVRVTLLYANRSREGAAFDGELAAMEAAGTPALSVVRVLSAADGDWKGERGHLDRSALVRHCGPALAGKSFYLCAPAAMSERLASDLESLGVRENRIHLERFRL